MVEFRIETPIEKIDIELAQISSLGEIHLLMNQLMKEKLPGGSINASLFPPFIGNITIPLAFKEIIKYHNELLAKEIKLIIYLKHEMVKDHLIKYLPYKDQPLSKYQVGKVDLIVHLGDIVKANTKAIVNASNNKLKLGGGVSGAIREAANPDIQIQLNKIALTRVIRPGEAVITDSFGIKGIEKIIHVSSVEGTEEVIRECLKNALLESEKHHITSLAIPALGAGTGGLQMKLCAEITMQQIFSFYREKEDPKMKKIKIVLWRKRDYDTFIKVINDQK